MDDRTRKRLDEIARQRAALEAEAQDLIRLAQDEMMRVAGLGPEERARALTAVNTPRRVKSNMQLSDVHKMAISKGRGKGPFFDAIRARGYTMRSLAEALDIPPSLLTMYRQADDPRPIPRERAERIEALTGFKAAAKNWPGGIA